MLRPVTLQDVKAITAIYNEYIQNSTATFEVTPLSEEEMRSRIAAISSHATYFVYEENQEVIGYCYAHPWKERAAYQHTWETTVYLSPQHRGKGIGRILIEHLVEVCREQGCHALIACITEENQSSVHFHEKLGFRRVSRFEQVGRKFDRWLNVVDYELLLES